MTGDGLEHRRTGYFIDRSDLGQKRDGDLWAWPLHMAERVLVRPGAVHGGVRTRGSALWVADRFRAGAILHDRQARYRVMAERCSGSASASRKGLADGRESLEERRSRTHFNHARTRRCVRQPHRCEKGPVHHAYRVQPKPRNARKSPWDRDGFGRMPVRIRRDRDGTPSAQASCACFRRRGACVEILNGQGTEKAG